MRPREVSAMQDALIDWDDEDDPHGNVQHIAENGPTVDRGRTRKDYASNEKTPTGTALAPSAAARVGQWSLGRGADAGGGSRVPPSPRSGGRGVGSLAGAAGSL